MNGVVCKLNLELAAFRIVTATLLKTELRFYKGGSLGSEKSRILISDPAGTAHRRSSIP